MPRPIDIGGPAASLAYQLSQGEAWTPQTVTVDVDGSGAASDFVVQVLLRHQSGELLAATRTDDTVTAGTSGVATFTPF